MKIIASSPITPWQIDEETMESETLISWAPKSLQWLQPWNKKMLVPWKESYDKPRQHIKKQRHPFDNKGLYSQSDGFSSSHEGM